MRRIIEVKLKRNSHCLPHKHLIVSFKKALLVHTIEHNLTTLYLSTSAEEDYMHIPITSHVFILLIWSLGRVAIVWFVMQLVVSLAIHDCSSNYNLELIYNLLKQNNFATNNAYSPSHNYISIPFLRFQHVIVATLHGIITITTSLELMSINVNTYLHNVS